MLIIFIKMCLYTLIKYKPPTKFLVNSNILTIKSDLNNLRGLQNVQFFQLNSDALQLLSQSIYRFIILVNSKMNLEDLEPPKRKMVKMEHQPQDRDNRPIIFQGRSVYVFIQKCSKQIHKFLRDVCQPISKPQKVHEYQITKQSLVRAQALGYKKQQIIKTLQQNMQNEGKIPKLIQNQIRQYVRENDCQLNLVWNGQSCHYRFVIEKYLFQSIRKIIQGCLVMEDKKDSVRNQKNIVDVRVQQYKHIELEEKLQKESMPVRADRVVSSFLPTDIKKLKGGKHLAYCHQIQINLKSFTQLRQYQAQALNAIVRVDGENTIANSGYVVLPCGAGKTLLGISILCKIKKQALIVCSSDAGTQQWKRQIQKWTQSFPREQIIITTSDNKHQFKNSTQGQIFISTYSYLKTNINSNAKNGIREMWLTTKPWGLVIFDECQTLPAKQNRQIVYTLNAQVKIGLTATPLREDDEIKNLNFMIGPQLYVGNWKTFVEQGYLANPKCIEIRTQLTPEFRTKYKHINEGLCYKINPNKIKALLFLLHHHEQLNDHILVFSDYKYILNFLAAKLRKPILSGDSKNQERMFIFDMFRQGKIKTLFLTRIGDEAIDLPNANVGIQLNIQHGSRKQMLQRLGRIMRQKQASSSLSYNAIFYTITTYDTVERKYFFKRYRCLINQGFHYDLRLFEFKPSQIEEIDNILKLDNKVREQIEVKFKNIIGSQEEYWNNAPKDQGDQ